MYYVVSCTGSGSTYLFIVELLAIIGGMYVSYVTGRKDIDITMPTVRRDGVLLYVEMG